jgi:hypothetical protein
MHPLLPFSSSDFFFFIKSFFICRENADREKEREKEKEKEKERERVEERERDDRVWSGYCMILPAHEILQ